MTEFGFSDEAIERARPPFERGPRRPTATGVTFTVGVIALVLFGGWAWLTRSHSDDLAAWSSLATTFEIMDRSLVPLGHSEMPPCRDGDDGIVSRSYPPSTGPQAAEVIGFLTQSGWSEQPAADGEAEGEHVLARLTKVEAGKQLTIEVSGTGLTRLAGTVVGRSPAGAIGCLGR